jgi:acetate kinase
LNTANDVSLNVLALNSGSSSLKFGLYGVSPSQTELVFSGEAEAIGEADSRLRIRASVRTVALDKAIAIPDQNEAIIQVAKVL